jgi:DNA invertase Pin-like site-specific DNA recombinase
VSKSVNTKNRQVTVHARVSDERKAEVRRLLLTGMMRNAIVDATGVSRRTVNRIAEELSNGSTQ